MRRFLGLTPLANLLFPSACKTIMWLVRIIWACCFCRKQPQLVNSQQLFFQPDIRMESFEDTFHFFFSDNIKNKIRCCSAIVISSSFKSEFITFDWLPCHDLCVDHGSHLTNTMPLLQWKWLQEVDSEKHSKSQNQVTISLTWVGQAGLFVQCSRKIWILTVTRTKWVQ